MCTVIVQVPQQAEQVTRLLAVRDEDPGRPWDPPGMWWPQSHAGVLGVRDRRANGAWLAADSASGRLAVVVNRNLLTAPDGSLDSRGGIVLRSIEGKPVPEQPHTAGFNLIEVAGAQTRVTTWDGDRLVRQKLEPGVHMIAHDDVDDPRTARIARWLPEFRAAAEGQDFQAGFDEWSREWLAVLATSSQLGPYDDRAIIRDNHPHGYPTLSLLVCVAEISHHAVGLRAAVLTEPGVWDDPDPVPF